MIVKPPPLVNGRLDGVLDAIQIRGETEPRVSLMRQETTVVTTPLEE